MQRAQWNINNSITILVVFVFFCWKKMSIVPNERQKQLLFSFDYKYLFVYEIIGAVLGTSGRGVSRGIGFLIRRSRRRRRCRTTFVLLAFLCHTTSFTLATQSAAFTSALGAITLRRLTPAGGFFGAHGYHIHAKGGAPSPSWNQKKKKKIQSIIQKPHKVFFKFPYENKINPLDLTEISRYVKKKLLKCADHIFTRPFFRLRE